MVEFCNINQKEYLLFETPLPARLSFITAIGLLFLLYPLVGHLTDVYLTRFRSLKWSFCVLILAGCLIDIFEGFVLAASSICNNTMFQHYPIDNVISIVFLAYIVGLALFQANAIQFGLDQLLEAPTPKLIAFIHYGGPFTNEEVEDTKTFLRILPLLLCLFGYHLAGDGYSAPEQLQRTSCPSLPVLLLIVYNPLHMSTLVSVVGIPLYRLVIVKEFPRGRNIRMLSKMWMGLYHSLLQVVLYIIVVVNQETTYWQQHHSVIPNGTEIPPSRQCYIIRTGCLFIHDKGTLNCQQYNDPVDNTYLWFIIPQLLNGLSSLFVSMTVFEFISAQAPHTTQGLLIGLWYATFSIRYLVVGILDNVIIERRSWLIYEGVKGFLTLVSLVLFSCVSRRYRYRQRDEIVNVQGMIEDTHERWLDQEEEYMQEQRLFYQTTETYNTLPLS